jgi:hypothetical protein
MPIHKKQNEPHHLELTVMARHLGELLPRIVRKEALPAVSVSSMTFSIFSHRRNHFLMEWCGADHPTGGSVGGKEIARVDARALLDHDGNELALYEFVLCLDSASPHAMIIATDAEGARNPDGLPSRLVKMRETLIKL